jgi:AcrR family transcriptional regulator
MDEAAAHVDEYPGDEHVDRALARIMGPESADLFIQVRRAQELRESERRPDEGLRERKRRLTRQRISDLATALVVTRGFDNVTVAQIAETVGVSEKTVYNYFPTKESMILDMADESVERLGKALRSRQPGESLTNVAVRAIRDDEQRLNDLPDEVYEWFPRFREMIFGNPSLRSAWLDLHNRLTDVAAEELATSADVDPRDPEPLIAARALVDLGLVAFDSRMRHIEAGLRGEELGAAVNADIERAARLLETGLWSFSLLAQGARTRAQLVEAQKAFERARRQVVSALKEARLAYRAARREAQRGRPG